MPSLWIPQSNKVPDVNNLFDMALVFQQTIVEQETQDDKIAAARLALESLGTHFNLMDKEERELSLETELALYLPDQETMRMVYDIGMRGELSGISFMHIGNISVGLTLGIETTETFSPRDPSSCEPTSMWLSAPIQAINYIEQAA